ncbi:MAG: tyrosine-type recombinase/integrase, partial [Nitrospinales bacterium]
CKIALPGRKPLYQSLGKNKKLAKALEAKIRADIHEGKFFEKNEGEYLTVAGLLDMYRVRHAEPNKKPESLRTDRFLGIRINEFFGKLFLKEVTPGRIEGYMVKRRADGVSGVTIHHELNLLRHAFNLAFKNWDLIKSDPFQKVKLPSGVNKRVRYLKSDEEKRLFEELEKRGDWLTAVVIIARETGLRSTNVCNLTWDQADLFKKAIEVEHTKNGRPVWIPMTENVYRELKKLYKVRTLGTNRVFWVDGKPIHRCWVGLAFRRLCKRAGIENFRFHDLRHDFCSRLVQAGQPLHVVAELAGHTNIATTQRYAHLSPEVKRNAIDALSGFNRREAK